MSDYFIFDDIDTRNYEGISVYFDEVDTTPKRVGEFIEIPNRNGSLFLDSGRYEDVTHTYDIIALSMQNGRNLINALASKVGHYRLEDSFNTGEYYSAVFDTEVEPTVTMERDKITFKVIFTRKPQRFLTSGETAVQMVETGSLNNYITNPTLFDSKPLLAVTGSGTVRIGTDPNSPTDYTIVLNNDTVGEIELLPELSNSTQFITRPSILWTRSYDSVPYALTDSGDTVTIPYFNIAISLRAATNQTIDSTTVTFQSSHAISNYSRYTIETVDERTVKATFFYGAQTWTKGSAQSIAEDSVKIECGVTTTDSSTGTTSTSTKTTNFKIERSFGSSGFVSIGLTDISGNMSRAGDINCGAVTATSTQSVLGSPTYIDCDIGEAYKIVNGTVISLNRYIELGSQLPVLVSGSNTVHRNSTSTPTSILVTPRWWKV